MGMAQAMPIYIRRKEAIMAVFGLIGLGKMGMEFCTNLLRAGHSSGSVGS